MQSTGIASKELLPLTLIRSAGLPFSFLEKCSASFLLDEERLQLAERRLSLAYQSVQTAFDTLLFALPEGAERTRVYQARQTFFQKKRLPDEGVLLVDENLETAFQELKNSEENFNGVKSDFKNNYQKSLLTGYSALRELAGNPDFQHALLFASHDLYKRLVVFSQASQGESFNKKDRQTAFALTRYATRMAAKTSPLGRFCGVGIPTNHNDEMPAFAQSRPIATPNVVLLPALYALLLTEKPFYNSLQVRLNPCITTSQDTSCQWLALEGDTEHFHQTNTTAFLDWLVQTMLESGGCLPWKPLTAATMAQVEASEEAVEKHLLRLFDNGLLEWVLPVDGFSASWCGQLYQYLGFLPSSPLITDVLNMLNWLRTTARIIPHQPPEKVRELQVEACTQWQDLFQRWSSVAPPVSPEQIFYEDLEWSAGLTVPEDDLEAWKQYLKELYALRPQVPLPLLHRRMVACWNLHFSDQVDVDFTTFCRVFLELEGSGQWAEGSGQKAEGSGEKAVGSGQQAAGSGQQAEGSGQQAEGSGQKAEGSGQKAEGSGEKAVGSGQKAEGSGQKDESVPLGVLLQPFVEGGQWMAVVNGLFVGGGKLVARWLHLFPAAERERLERWHKKLKLEVFPSQGWYNANFQPQPQNRLLCTPGARWKKQADEVRLGDIRVRFKGPGLELMYPDGTPVLFTDLGLEAPETRPPAMQLLHQLTVPHVGIRTLIPNENWSEITPGMRHRPRIAQRNLVFVRQAWSVDENVWRSWLNEREHQAMVYRQLCTSLRAMGAQRYFFYAFPEEKPQMVDLHSPLLMQVFEKDLRHGSGTLLITEMLPTPDQAGERAWELVVDPI